MLSRFSRILVVEGCAVSRRAIQVALHALGFHNVDFASDGRVAIRPLSQHFYRLVLADSTATSVNGLEILQAMRGDPRLKRTPLILTVDRMQKKFIEIARDDGLTFYLTRPVTTAHLADRVGQIDGVPFGSRSRPISAGFGSVTPPAPPQSLRRSL